MTELRIVPLDPKLRALAESFEGKVRYAAHYHGLSAGPIIERHTAKNLVYTIPISVPGGRRIGEVAHVQYKGVGRAKGQTGFYTTTRLGGVGSHGKSGIMLGWLKEAAIEQRKPNLRIVTAEDVLGATRATRSTQKPKR